MICSLLAKTYSLSHCSGVEKPNLILRKGVLFFTHINLFLTTILIVLVSTTSYAGDSTPSYTDKSLLDGKTFIGEIGLMGKPAIFDEEIIFRDWKFISAECERKCGYTEGDYWIQHTPNGIKFKTRTNCKNADATMDWEGTVLGDRIEGEFLWTSERWYGTTEKKFWFSGELVESPTNGTN